MGKPLIGSLLAGLAAVSDLVIIEGVMGLFDGPHGARGSTADLAAELGLPVILALDCRHQAQSAAAVAHGFSSFRKDLHVAGVILNRVASARHEAILKEAMTLPVLASLPNDAALAWPSRHLGLVQSQEKPELEEFVEAAAARVGDPALLDRVMELAAPVTVRPGHAALPPLGQTIAVARDEAFAFAYPHLLDGWREQGAELSFFSPLANEAPDRQAQSVFLPGGYPELQAGRLAANTRFLGGLRSHPGLIYGECGGYMVLGESLTDAEGRSHAMAGLLPLATSFASRKLHLGYRRLSPLPGAPWAKPLTAHEFHYSTQVAEAAADRLFDAEDAAGTALPPMGLRRGRVMGSYAHVIAEAP
jgi:cobyrinic acid a,c-diamide synthase